jgi:hypothetical protein
MKRQEPKPFVPSTDEDLARYAAAGEKHRRERAARRSGRCTCLRDLPPDEWHSRDCPFYTREEPR